MTVVPCKYASPICHYRGGHLHQLWNLTPSSLFCPVKHDHIGLILTVSVLWRSRRSMWRLPWREKEHAKSWVSSICRRKARLVGVISCKRPILTHPQGNFQKHPSSLDNLLTFGRVSELPLLSLNRRFQHAWQISIIQHIRNWMPQPRLSASFHAGIRQTSCAKRFSNLRQTIFQSAPNDFSICAKRFSALRRLIFRSPQREMELGWRMPETSFSP